MEIKKFLGLEKPEEYDFKLEMKEYYKQHDDFVKEIKEKIDDKDSKKDFISSWFAYKTMESERPNGEHKFDCDNSNDTCELTKAIYYYLWGWEKTKNNFGDLLILKDMQGEDIVNAYGGDTMNSLGITMIEYTKKVMGKKVKSVNGCKDVWEPATKSEKEEAGNKELNNFARYTSCIGNFVLVPRGFNGYRGICSFIRDYWDLSLDYLAHEEKRDNKEFVKYINMFFLWDYVNKDDYEVKPLFDSHKSNLSFQTSSSKVVSPKEKEDFDEFFKNVNHCIRRRGQFMVAMLKLAVEFKEESVPDKSWKDKWPDWEVSNIYKYIMEKVFLTGEEYEDFNSVIKKIEKEIKDKQYEEVNSILKKLTGEETFCL